MDKIGHKIVLIDQDIKRFQQTKSLLGEWGYELNQATLDQVPSGPAILLLHLESLNPQDFTKINNLIALQTYALVALVDASDKNCLKYCEAISFNGLIPWPYTKEAIAEAQHYFLKLTFESLVGNFETIMVQDQRYNELKRTHQDLVSAYKTLERQRVEEAAKDPLTELCSPKVIMNKLMIEEARFMRHRRPFCLLLLDIDRLNEVVARVFEASHLSTVQIAETILVQVAEILRDGLRAGDSISRWHEDAYLILLPDTDKAGGKLLGNRLLEVVSQTALSLGTRVPCRIQMTGALKCFDGSLSSYEALDALDKILSDAKSEGGNCLRVL